MSPGNLGGPAPSDDPAPQPNRVQSALAGDDLAEFRWAVRTLPLGEALTATSLLMASQDPLLKPDAGRLCIELADSGQLDATLTDRYDDLVFTVLLASQDGPAGLLAHHLADNPGLAPETMPLVAAAVPEPKQRLHALRRALGDLDVDDRTGLLRSLCNGEPARDLDDAILEARPATARGCDRHIRLVADRVCATQWIPDPERFLRLAEAWAPLSLEERVGAEFPGSETTAFLRGLARTWSKQGQYRASAVAAIAQITVAPDAEAVGRAIFEAGAMTDLPLLAQAVDAAVWVEETVDPRTAGRFVEEVSIGVDRLRSAGDRRRAGLVAGLAEAAVGASTGPLPGRAARLLDKIRHGASEDPAPGGLNDLVAENEIRYAIWGWSAVDTHDTGPRVPAAQVLRLAWDAGGTKAWGPLSLLQVADLAIEFGDLRLARGTLDYVIGRYPRHSPVVFAGIKIAAHVRDDRVANELLDQLARLWNPDADESHPRAQVVVLEQLADLWVGSRLARLRAGALLGDPRFAAFRGALEEIRG